MGKVKRSTTTYVIQYLFVAGVLGGLFYMYIWPTVSLVQSLENLERNAKRVITGTELQQWATGVLASASTNRPLKSAELRTNLPPQLLGLMRRAGPSVWVEEGDTNSPASVCLHWGSGVIGSAGFEIGPTNFVSYRPHARAWQPGVYFWSLRPERRR